MNTINSEYDNYNNKNVIYDNVRCCPSFPSEDEEDNNTFIVNNN